MTDAGFPPLPDDDDALEGLMHQHLDPVGPSPDVRARVLQSLQAGLEGRVEELARPACGPCSKGVDAIVEKELPPQSGPSAPPGFGWEEDEDEDEEALRPPRWGVGRSSLRREPSMAPWIVLVAGVAVAGVVSVGLSVAGSKVDGRYPLELWLALPEGDDDLEAKLRAGEALPPALKATPEFSRAFADLRERAAIRERRSQALAVLARLGDASTLEERLQIHEEALAIDRTLTEAWVESARLRFALDRRAALGDPGAEATEITRGARTLLQQALASGTSAAAYVFESELCRFERDGRAALKCLHRAQEVDPEGALGALARGLEQELDSRFGDATTELERAIELDRKLVPAYLALARVRLAEGVPSLAIASADQARALDPGSSEARVLLAEARYYASGCRDRGVLGLLVEAHELDPSDSRALALRAYARLERTSSGVVTSGPAVCARAKEDAERANAIRPEAFAWLTLAELALWREGQPQRARSYATEALNLDARRIDSWMLRARIELVLDAKDLADRDLERVLALAESRPGTEELTARALTMRGGIGVSRRDYAAAKDLLRRAIRLDDDVAEAHLYLGKALHLDPQRQAGDWRKAEEAYSTALSKDGSLADAWFHRGCLHIDRSRSESVVAKEWEAGLRDLEIAEALLRSDAADRATFGAHYLDFMRGVAYFGLEEWARAKTHLERYLAASSPGEDLFAKAQDMLRQIEVELGGR
ncbi:MAG: hypothetical protein R3F62_04625 [Planctomycetota bacterium]